MQNIVEGNVENIENAVIEHYEDARLLERILAGLEDSGIDINNLKPDDLAPIEEFHTGGRKATQYIIEKLGLQPENHVLDIGCGIGGAARYIAAQIGSRVTGIDLTPEYITAAKVLSERVKLDDKLQFEAASALALPFEDASFDAAVTLHVAMNIKDRTSFYSEISRVMKPGSVLGIFDVMKKNDEDLIFPLPWAQSPATSHLITAEETSRFLTDVGFTVTDVEDRTDFALEFFAQGLAAQTSEAPSLGIHLLIGDTAREKFTNILNNIKAGRISPVQIIATRN